MRLIALPLPAVATALLVCSAGAGAAVRHARAAFATRPATASMHVIPGSSAGNEPTVPEHQPFAEPADTSSHSAPASHSPTVPPRAAPQTWRRRERSRPDVDRWTRIFTRDAETTNALRRLDHYFQLFNQALTENGVPSDFVALPLIESAVNPQATSRVGAAGIWQLMPATARAYGLEVSPWVDERRDPVRATYAAAHHLHDLHAELGSWNLVAAAYNCGAGRLRRAIGASRGDEAYWRFRHRLPRETRDYVPKLLAAVEITTTSRASRSREPIPSLQFTEIWIDGGIELSAVAAERGIDADALIRLNPHLVRRSTPPGRAWPVRIPIR